MNRYEPSSVDDEIDEVVFNARLEAAVGFSRWKKILIFVLVLVAFALGLANDLSAGDVTMVLVALLALKIAVSRKELRILDGKDD